jgi:hypothetical protein
MAISVSIATLLRGKELYSHLYVFFLYSVNYFGELFAPSFNVCMYWYLHVKRCNTYKAILVQTQKNNKTSASQF